jgi:hypothetical protein
LWNKILVIGTGTLKMSWLKFWFSMAGFNFFVFIWIPVIAFCSVTNPDDFCPDPTFEIG